MPLLRLEGGSEYCFRRVSPSFSPPKGNIETVKVERSLNPVEEETEPERS
jgi:hypothetical protein